MASQTAAKIYSFLNNLSKTVTCVFFFFFFNVEKARSVFFTAILCISSRVFIILRLHYVPGGHVSDNRDKNGITVRQRRGTG